jgi:hypothetical protein
MEASREDIEDLKEAILDLKGSIDTLIEQNTENTTEVNMPLDFTEVLKDINGKLKQYGIHGVEYTK